MLAQTLNEAVVPTDHDTVIARTSSKTLDLLFEANEHREAHLRFATGGDQGQEIPLPPAVVRILVTALHEMAKGHSVTIMPIDTELTTQQAAKMMRLSRPSLIKMLDERRLPYRKVGAHRRIRYEDVLHYLERERERRKKVMEELVAETESLGLYK